MLGANLVLLAVLVPGLMLAATGTTVAGFAAARSAAEIARLLALAMAMRLTLAARPKRWSCRAATSALELAAAVEQRAALGRGPLRHDGRRRQRCVAVGEPQDGVGDGVAHLVQGFQRQVAEIVTGLMIAGIVGCPGRAAVDPGLLGRLDAFGAGEQTTGRDAGVDERPIVGAAVEGGRLGGQARGGEVVGEDLLDLRRAGRTRRAGVAEPSPS